MQLHELLKQMLHAPCSIFFWFCNVCGPSLITTTLHCTDMCQSTLGKYFSLHFLKFIPNNGWFLIEKKRYFFGELDIYSHTEISTVYYCKKYCCTKSRCRWVWNLKMLLILNHTFFFNSDKIVGPTKNISWKLFSKGSNSPWLQWVFWFNSLDLLSTSIYLLTLS